MGSGWHYRSSVYRRPLGHVMWGCGHLWLRSPVGGRHWHGDAGGKSDRLDHGASCLDYLWRGHIRRTVELRRVRLGLHSYRYTHSKLFPKNIASVNQYVFHTHRFVYCSYASRADILSNLLQLKLSIPDGEANAAHAIDLARTSVLNSNTAANKVRRCYFSIPTVID